MGRKVLGDERLGLDMVVFLSYSGEFFICAANMNVYWGPVHPLPMVYWGPEPHSKWWLLL